MNRPYRISSICVALPWVLALFSVAATGQSTDDVPGASDLAGALAQHHGYLFSDADNAAVDTANRQLREAERTMARGEKEAERAKAKEERSTQAAALLRLVDGVDALAPLTLPTESGALPKYGPVELPGDTGALLFKVNPEGGNPRCIAVTLDFADGRNRVDVPGVDPDRTNYVLVTLKRVPARTVSIILDFATTTGTHIKLPVDLTTPEQGRLQFSVLSDDTGDPAPAMVRLLWKTSGEVYAPGNALDFTSELDSQSGRSTGFRRANLHGKLAGDYWCVPGPVDMSLPPGDWEVVVRRGGEHLPVMDSFRVNPGETVARTYRPERWVDMRKKGWYSGDDHIHFQLLSDFDAEQLMTWLRAEDVHLGNVLKMGDMYRTWFEQRGFGPDYRIREDDYILVPGQECPRTHDQLGHTISLNLTDMVRDTSRYYQYDWVFETVQAQGGLSGFAHVNSGIFHVHRGMTLIAPKGLIDFVELLQFANLGTDLYYDFLNLGFKVTASAGSDVPWGGTIGEVRVYAYTGRWRFTADKWFDALERGNTFVTNGPMIDFRVDRARPGDEVTVDEGERVRVRAKAWGANGFTTPVKLEIVRHGEVIETVTADSESGEMLETEIEVDPGAGCWLAARVEATEGYRAHTTPVYVVREGMRFWKYDAVPGLLKKRQTSLDEIEGLIVTALEHAAQGDASADKWQVELARQADALRSRIAEARAYYATLERQLKAEAEARGIGSSAVAGQ